MDTKKLQIQCTTVGSSQQWATDPSMIQVDLSIEFLRKVERCIAFMKTNGAHKVIISWAFGASLYSEFDGDGDLAKDPIMEGKDGKQYVKFDPKYKLDCVNAEICEDGDIRALFPFKHSSDELWCDVGNIKDLLVEAGCTAVIE